MNIHIQAFMCRHMISPFLGRYLGAEWLGHVVKSGFYCFGETNLNFLKSKYHPLFTLHPWIKQQELSWIKEGKKWEQSIKCCHFISVSHFGYFSSIRAHQKGSALTLAQMQ